MRFQFDPKRSAQRLDARLRCGVGNRLDEGLAVALLAIGVECLVGRDDAIDGADIDDAAPRRFVYYWMLYMVATQTK